MKLLYTLNTACTVGSNNNHVKFDAFKVLDSDYDITLFITIDSICEVLAIDVESQGSIKGVDVVDIQTLIDALEAHQHPLFGILAADFDKIQETQPELHGYVDYERVKPYMSRLPRNLQIQVLKQATQDMSEHIYIEAKSYNWLKRKYGSRRATAKTTKGFAA